MIRTKLTEMQESVEFYERLGLKTEYLYAYRMLIFLILQSGDFNGLAREFSKFVGDTGLNIEAVRAMSDYWEQARAQYVAFESGLAAPASEVYLHEMPGGQTNSNMRS